MIREEFIKVTSKTSQNYHRHFAYPGKYVSLGNKQK